MPRHLCGKKRPDVVMVSPTQDHAALMIFHDWDTELAQTEISYCPFCGQPLTQEALDEVYGLERSW